MSTAQIVETALGSITLHTDKQAVTDIASLLGQWIEGQITRDTVRSQLQEHRFASFLQDVEGKSIDAEHVHIRFGNGKMFRTITITIEGSKPLSLRIPLHDNKRHTTTRTIQSIVARWEQMTQHPVIFFPVLGCIIIGFIVTLLNGLVAIGADSSGFTAQINTWGMRCEFSPERDNETLIIITTFEQAEGSRGTDPHDKIRKQLDVEANNLGIPNIRAEICDITIDSNTPDNGQKRAERLGSRYNASIVVWGQYTSADITTHFLNLKQPNSSTFFVTINEFDRVELINPAAYANFVTNDLPHQISFLALFALGDAMYNQERFTKATQIIEHTVHLLKNVQTVPEGAAAAYFRLGWLYYFPQQDKLQAFEAFTRVIELNPYHFGAYNNLGLAYADQGYYELALADYNQAIELNPTYTSAYNNRGVTHAKQQHYELAITDFNQAIELDPTNAGFYNNRGLAYAKQQHYELAITDFNQAIELDPTYTSAYNNRGATHADQGRYELAITDYTQAIKLNPTNKSAYYNRGLAYADQGCYELAITDYTQAIELDPNAVLAYSNRGLAYANQGQYELAFENLNQAIELDPNAALAYYNRGLAYANRGQYELALNDFTYIINISDDLSLQGFARQQIDRIENQ